MLCVSGISMSESHSRSLKSHQKDSLKFINWRPLTIQGKYARCNPVGVAGQSPFRLHNSPAPRAKDVSKRKHKAQRHIARTLNYVKLHPHTPNKSRCLSDTQEERNTTTNRLEETQPWFRKSVTTTIRLEKLNRHSLGGGLVSPTRRPSKCRWKWRVKPRAGGRGVYIAVGIVIETELENVVDIRPGMPGMFMLMFKSVLV